MPGAAHCAAEHATGRGIIDNPLAFRIPPNLSAEEHCDVSQVCNRSRPMAHLDWRNRLGTSLDAIQEVATMTLTVVA